MQLRTTARWTAWIEAGWIFILSRFVIIALTLIAVIHMPMAQASSPRPCAFDGACFLTWYFHWDVIAYSTVATQGYLSLRDTVFFPLWPLLLHVVGILFGGPSSYYLVGLLLANLFCYLALVLLYQLVRADVEPSVAKRTLLYLAFAPYGVYLFIGYTKSLFLMLCLALFFFLQRGRWWLAGLCGFFAALTRSQGVLLLIPFAVMLIQRMWLGRGTQDTQTPWTRWHKVRASLPLLLIPLGVAAYMGYLLYTKGDALAFSTQEATSWDRHLTVPFFSLFAAIQTLFLNQPNDFHLLNALDVSYVLLAIAVLAVGWKRLPLHYSLFAATLILFALSYPQGIVEPLTSAPRYMLIAFPVFVILGMLGKQQHFDRLILACFLPLFTLNTIFFVSHYWVA